MLRRLKNYFHLFEAIFACLWYGFPAKKLSVVGVTGTDGKTTTATLLYHILNSKGKKVVLISTIGAYINGKFYDTGSHTTTPTAFAIQKFLKLAVNSGCQYAVIEVTSHALDQNRTWGIPYKIGIITNVTQEHLDYHKTHMKYVAVKQKLLSQAALAIVNRDDASFETFERTINSGKLLSYSLKNSNATLTLANFKFKTKLTGDFNKQNVLAAALAAKQLGLTDSEIKSAIETFEPPQGRQEIVYDKKFRIIVDFAHTPNAFAKMLPVAKDMTEKRLIHIFGAAGERDKFKRPEMGKISAKFADVIILTAEDSRSENVFNIMDQVAQGFPQAFKLTDASFYQASQEKVYFRISERRKAIKFAVSIAGPGDVLLLTGKGHEKSLNVNGQELPWDEAKIALESVHEKTV